MVVGHAFGLAEAGAEVGSPHGIVALGGGSIGGSSEGSHSDTGRSLVAGSGTVAAEGSAGFARRGCGFGFCCGGMGRPFKCG